MECPVCGNKKISPFATHCLECGADVLAFPLLDDLEEQCVVTLKENVSLEGELAALTQLRKSDKRIYQKKLNRMYWFLFLLPLLLFWCGKKPIVDKLGGEKEINRLQSENDSLKNHMSSLKFQIDKLVEFDKEKGPGRVVHIVEDNDNLSLLSGKYLGKETDWPTLVELNPGIDNPDFLQIGDTIVIKLR